MKFQPEQHHAHSIRAYGPGWVMVGAQRLTHSFTMHAGQPPQPWPVPTFDALGESHFLALAEQAPELILFGSGQSLRFPRPAWLRPLAQRRIGIETMSTPAACRTFNILADEGRRVLLAMLIETESIG